MHRERTRQQTFALFLQSRALGDFWWKSGVNQGNHGHAPLPLFLSGESGQNWDQDSAAGFKKELADVVQGHQVLQQDLSGAQVPGVLLHKEFG